MNRIRKTVLWSFNAAENSDETYTVFQFEGYLGTAPRHRVLATYGKRGKEQHETLYEGYEGYEKSAATSAFDAVVAEQVKQGYKILSEEGEREYGHPRQSRCQGFIPRPSGISLEPRMKAKKCRHLRNQAHSRCYL